MDKELGRSTTEQISASRVEVTCFGHVKFQHTAYPYPKKGSSKPFENLNKGTLILEWNE